MEIQAPARDAESYAVIGAAMEVHRELRHGFLEAVYQDALALEFSAHQIPFEREKVLQVRYKQDILPSSYKADFICFGSLLVECKALSHMGSIEEAQVINYLRVTGIEKALLINFGLPSLQTKRIVFTNKPQAESLIDS
ncbi:MAG: GxxExxY protein [Candidatus Methylacidiphilales bacterium]